MPTLSLKMHNFERWRRTNPFSSTRTTGDHGNLLATNVNPRKLIVQHPLFNLQQPLVNRSWTRFISDWLLPASQWPVYSPEISTTDKNIFMREHCKEWWLKIRGNYFVTIKKNKSDCVCGSLYSQSFLLGDVKGGCHVDESGKAVQVVTMGMRKDGICLIKREIKPWWV